MGSVRLGIHDEHRPRHRKRRSRRRANDERDTIDPQTQAALDHIDAWLADPRRRQPYEPWHHGPQRWVATRGDNLLLLIVGVGLTLMLAGWLFGHGLYDIGEGIALGGGGLFAQLLLALEAGGVVV